MFKNFKIKLNKALIAIMLAGVMGPCFADNSQMNQTLAQMINQLNALLPLLEQAQKQQDKNTPTQFHFESWTDRRGVKHAGLKQDILTIRQGLIDQINQPPLEPRTVQPINNDYIGQ